MILRFLTFVTYGSFRFTWLMAYFLAWAFKGRYIGMFIAACQMAEDSMDSLRHTAVMIQNPHRTVEKMISQQPSLASDMKRWMRDVDRVADAVAAAGGPVSQGGRALKLSEIPGLEIEVPGISVKISAMTPEGEVSLTAHERIRTADSFATPSDAVEWLVKDDPPNGFVSGKYKDDFFGGGAEVEEDEAMRRGLIRPDDDDGPEQPDPVPA